MEIISLRTFKAIVDEGGIKGASALLHTVPSNISARVQKLEEELDASLFSLNGRKLELTDTGKLLYDYASQILQLEQQATLAIQQRQGSFELHIGTPETFAAVHLPRALKSLRQTNREIIPKIRTATSAELIQEVLDGKIDCAIAGSVTENDELAHYPLIDEPLVLVEPIDGDSESVLFVREPGCAYRECALEWQQEIQRADDEMMTMSSVDGVLGCVAAGLGYTVIGEDMVLGSRYESSLRTQKVSTSRTAINISMIHRRGHPLTDAIQRLVTLFVR